MPTVSRVLAKVWVVFRDAALSDLSGCMIAIEESSKLAAGRSLQRVTKLDENV